MGDQSIQKSLRENIYSALKAEILTCHLMPSSELREQQLADRFGVSKSPVREALLRLEKERLVVVAPRQGYRVAAISLEGAREMFHLRKVLEAACAEAAAVAASDETLRALERYRIFPGPDDHEAFTKYNRSFHSAVCHASCNARMAELTLDIIEQMERMIRFSVATVPPQDRSILVAEHNAIIDALIARERRKASRLMKEHVSAAEKRVVLGLTYTAVRA